MVYGLFVFEGVVDGAYRILGRGWVGEQGVGKVGGGWSDVRGCRRVGAGAARPGR